MKKILLLSLLIVSCNNSVIPVKEVLFDGISVPVVKIEESTYDADFFIVDDLNKKIYELKEFDTDGFLVHAVVYHYKDGLQLDVQKEYKNGINIKDIRYFDYTSSGYGYKIENIATEVKPNFKKVVSTDGIVINDSLMKPQTTVLHYYYDGLKCSVLNSLQDTISVTTYNNAGLCLEEITYEDNCPIKTVYEYDNDGNLTKEITKGVKMTYSYSNFDSHGNWTTKETYVNGVKQTITKRNILYR